MITLISNFFVTQLIWSITNGIYHLALSFILLFMFLKLWDHLSWFRAFWIAFFLVISSFALFFALVNVIFVWGLKIPYVLPEDTYQGNYNYLMTSLFLGFIYILLQTIQLFIIRHWIRLQIWRVFLCIVCANVMSSLLVYKMMV